MKAQTILNKLLIDVTPHMHKVRRKALNALVTSLISGAALSVTSLGRHINSKTSEKHQIKRSTRLCSNSHLYLEKTDIYARFCQRLIGQQKHPIILVDWSDLDPRKQHFLLRAAVAIDGRSLTLLEEIHPLSTKEKPAVHKQFMVKLKSILPRSCRPIIVTDAGFRVPWFNLITTLNWDYVGRVRHSTFCLSEQDKDWHPVKDLYRQSSIRAKALGSYQLARRNPISCEMVVYQGKKKGRTNLTATGDRKRRSKSSLNHSAREKEPWLLATSLKRQYKKRFAKQIVAMYQCRMQIEESFRDFKTGLNYHVGDTRQLKRLEVLMLIAMLAQFVLYLLGMAVKLAGKQRHYQANSIRSHNVLSYQFLGLRAYRDKQLRLKKSDWDLAYTNIQRLISEPATMLV